MDINLYKKLYDEGLISQETFEKASYKQKNPLFSVHWELKTLLYLGVMLLSTGLGILIYKNIDTIGHQVILLFIALICGGCFAYCIKNKKPFSRDKVTSPSSFFDYILLLGCLSMLSFLGYLQFQYHVFGIHYGMATLIPMLVLFVVAYQFDHLGILGLAITNLGLWMGVTVSPYSLLYGVFDGITLIFTSLLLGLILLAAGYLSGHYNFKKHFKFSYLHFGLNISFISLLTGYFVVGNGYSEQSSGYIWLIGVFILGFFLFIDSFKDKSFYFLLLTILYLYIAISILAVRGLMVIDDGNAVALGFLYFIASAIALILLLINLNKKLK